MEFKTRIDPSSETYNTRSSNVLALVNTVQALKDKLHERSEREHARFETRGQRLRREHAELLLGGGANLVYRSEMFVEDGRAHLQHRQTVSRKYSADRSGAWVEHARPSSPAKQSCVA